MAFIKDRPLVRAGDQRFFVGRLPEVDQTMSAVSMSLNVVIYGPRGSGRTSFAAFVHARQCEKRTRESIFVSAPRSRSPVEVITAIAEEVAGAEGRFRSRYSVVEDIAGRWEASPTPRRQVLAAIERIADYFAEDRSIPRDGDGPLFSAGEEALIIVDGVSASAALRLFDGYASELAKVPATWIVTIDEENDGAKYVGQFFDVCIALSPLSREAATELVASRLAGVEVASDLLLETENEEALQPRALVTRARELALGNSFTGGASTHAQRQEAWNTVTSIGRPAAMLVTEMRVRGPVSASDEGLLDAMGWSRSRASEVLRQLHAHDLVSAIKEPGDGGRPRTVYALKPELR